MPDNKTFKCKVLTTQESLLDGEALSAVFPATDGLMGVLAHRAPMLVALGSGVLTVQLGDRRGVFNISGGLAHMADNVLTIITERCIPA
jgi:F-type H+-transporting ATPase subunit epsilon